MGLGVPWGGVGRWRKNESGGQERAPGSDGQSESLAWVLCLKPGVWMTPPREWVQKRRRQDPCLGSGTGEEPPARREEPRTGGCLGATQCQGEVRDHITCC